MKKTLVSLVFGMLLILAGGYYFYTTGFLKEISQDSVEFIEKNFTERVNAPEPLRKDTDDANAFLSIDGVIEETNRQRREAGLPELKENAKLDVSAQKKVDDMFQLQYFEHEAPNGDGAGDLVKSVGYDFIIVGENLALGNYKDDKALVQAWMDSPGHRENILRESYTEIGVGVARGVFEGKETWLAVQHFARPLSDCPAVDDDIKSKIDANNSQLDQMKADLISRKQELENSHPETTEERSDHNKKVDEYNALVEEYNSLLATTKELVSQYNEQVQNFNACAKTGE